MESLTGWRQIWGNFMPEKKSWSATKLHSSFSSGKCIPPLVTLKIEYLSIRLACVVTAWQGRTAATLLLAASQWVLTFLGTLAGFRLRYITTFQYDSHPYHHLRSNPLAKKAPETRFLVAPYSLFVSMALAVALAPPIYLSHYVSFSLIQVNLLPSIVWGSLSFEFFLGVCFNHGNSCSGNNPFHSHRRCTILPPSDW